MVIFFFLFYEHSQVIRSVNCGVYGHHKPWWDEIRAENKVVQPAVCWRLVSAEQSALMCFTGLTADSDEGIYDAARHFVVERKKKSGFSTGGEKIIQISSNAPLFL